MSSYDEETYIQAERQAVYKNYKNEGNEFERAASDQKTEEKRLEDENMVNIKLRERLTKQNNERKMRQNSIAGSGNDLGTEVIRITEDYIKLVYGSLKDIKRMIDNGNLVKKEALSEQDCKSIIKEYESLKAQITQLDKINQKLEVLNKTDRLKEKYEIAKTSIEQNISKQQGIEKSSLKNFEGKNKTELQSKDFRNKIVNRISEFSEIYKTAKERLQEITKEKKDLRSMKKQANKCEHKNAIRIITPKK